MANNSKHVHPMKTLFRPGDMINGRIRLVKSLNADGYDKEESPSHVDFLARDSGNYLILFRVFDPSINFKAEQLSKAAAAVRHNEYMVRPLEAGMAGYPVRRYRFTTFEPIIPLTCFLSYNSGRRQCLPPKVIWNLAKAAVEGLDCLHAQGFALRVTDFSDFYLTFPSLHRASSWELREIFHSPWVPDNLLSSAKLQRGSLRDIEYRIRLGPLEYLTTVHDLTKIRDKFSCPAPEGRAIQQLGPPTNIWTYGNMASNFVIIELEQTLTNISWKLAQRVCGGRRQQIFDVPSGNYHEPNSNVLYDTLKAASDVGPKQYGLAFPDHDLRIFADLLKQMLVQNPRDRITAHAAVRHPFFSHERPTTGGVRLGSAQPAPGRARSTGRQHQRPASPRRQPQHPRRGGPSQTSPRESMTHKQNVRTTTEVGCVVS